MLVVNFCLFGAVIFQISWFSINSIPRKMREDFGWQQLFLLCYNSSYQPIVLPSEFLSILHLNLSWLILCHKHTYWTGLEKILRRIFKGRKIWLQPPGMTIREIAFGKEIKEEIEKAVFCVFKYVKSGLVIVFILSACRKPTPFTCKAKSFVSLGCAEA